MGVQGSPKGAPLGEREIKEFLVCFFLFCFGYDGGGERVLVSVSLKGIKMKHLFRLIF